MTHAAIDPSDKERLCITPSLIRLSVGVEHPDDLIRDLNEALKVSGASLLRNQEPVADSGILR